MNMSSLISIVIIMIIIKQFFQDLGIYERMVQLEKEIFNRQDIGEIIKIFVYGFSNVKEIQIRQFVINMCYLFDFFFFKYQNFGKNI